jgi:hypothetical protein
MSGTLITPALFPLKISSQTYLAEAFMNSLDRTSLKKVGYDNGWEIANDNPADRNKMVFARIGFLP